jgi:hypothetical protein
MKKFLLFLLLLLSFYSKGQTNVYHPFPDSNAVWNVVIRESCINPSDYCEQLYSYIITGDTIIGSNNYHKLSVPIVERVATGLTCLNCTGFWPGGGAGFIRQDIPAKKVYFIESGNSVEQLLYDFNMQVGDTVGGYIEPSACISNPSVVASIDSILIGSSYRKRWDLTGGHYEYLIEGMGLTFGIGTIVNFLGKSDCGFIDASGPSLICFTQNDTIQYHPLSSYACEVITGTKNISEDNISLIISPNPAHNKLNIECKLQNAELKIYDIMGREVLEEKIHSSLSTFNFQLLEGVYFVRVSDGSKTAVQKLVVE